MPSPVGRGWKIEKDGENQQLVVHWMDGQPAPQAILDLLACNCPRAYILLWRSGHATPIVTELSKCECMANGLKCTDMCRVPDCDNQANSMPNDVESSNELEDNEFEDELEACT